jgi:hypothetical protein
VNNLLKIDKDTSINDSSKFLDAKLLALQKDNQDHSNNIEKLEEV